MTARHLLEGTTVLAGAAMIAAGAQALPVYEICKVGEDPRWEEGLDLMGLHGLSLVLVPHWNNTDGGMELDTSRTCIGQEQFDKLCRLLEEDRTIVGCFNSSSRQYHLIPPAVNDGVRAYAVEVKFQEKKRGMRISRNPLFSLGSGARI